MSSIFSQVNSLSPIPHSSKSQSISPKKKSPQATYLTNSALTKRNKSIVQSEAQKSLVEKILQNQLAHEEPYQNLLIQEKQIQLHIIEEEQVASNLKKKYKKTDSRILQVKSQLEKANFSLAKKQEYLNRFYTHLDSKLKTNVNSQLFAKLTKIENVLNQKYLQQKQELTKTLEKQQQRAEQFETDLKSLRDQKDELVKLYTHSMLQRAENERTTSDLNDPSSDSHKIGHKDSIQSHGGSLYSGVQRGNQSSLKSKKREDKINEKETAKEEIQFMKQNIKRLRQQKQALEGDQKLLKSLLNIEQTHRKYSGYIVNGYKKQFNICCREAIHKKRNSPITLPVAKADISELQTELNQKKMEKDILKGQIEERNQVLESTKLKLNEQIGDYSELENRIMRASNHGGNGSRQSYYQN